MLLSYFLYTDAPLTGAPQQLPPTASSPSEVFTAGMFDDARVSGIHVCTCNLNCEPLDCISVCVCFFFLFLLDNAARQPPSIKHKTCTPNEGITLGMRHVKNFLHLSSFYIYQICPHF